MIALLAAFFLFPPGGGWSPGGGGSRTEAADAADSLARTRAAQQSRIRDSRLPVYGITVVREFPHDPGAFTQGLAFSHRYLYESTGLKGKSSIRQVELETGKVAKLESLPGELSGTTS
jgi:glutamine cyclotransferase